MPDDEGKLIAVVQAAKLQASMKVTIPKKVVEQLDLSNGSFLGYYEEKGKIVIKKVE